MKATLLRLSLAAAAAMVVTGANAADLPRPVYKGPAYVAEPLFSWTGFYIGANAGYGFGKSDWSGFGASPSPKGFVGGGQIGYNYQIGSFVFGLEGDYDYSAMKGDAACPGGTCTTKNTWLATGRGRIGYAFDRFLPYFTGGVAFGSIKAEHTLLGNASSNRTGYALGGGLEYAFLGAWSVRAEYLYVDLGSFDAGPAPLVNNIGFKANVVRAGINYRF